MSMIFTLSIAQLKLKSNTKHPHNFSAALLAMALSSYAALGHAQLAPAAGGLNTSQTEPSAEEMAEIQAQQQAAQAAAAADVGHKPLTGPITQKPAYISDIEWMVLKGTAAERPHSDEELTRMVNQLRFVKQKDAWSSLTNLGTQDPATLNQRRALAEQLLQDLPDRVANQEMDFPSAQDLQKRLLKDAEPNKAQQSKRADSEFKRLLAANELATQRANASAQAKASAKQ